MIDDVVPMETLDQAARDRRQHDRVAGPFDGLRAGALETPLSIFDLSQGGCFVNSMYDQTPGVRFVMRIALPNAGLLTLNAETLYGRSGFGFAVRFVDMDDETASCLNGALEQLRDKADD
jgi:PilZ domain-containing protein